MSPSVPRRHGQPGKAVSKEGRVARGCALWRARSHRYHQRQHQQAIHLHRVLTELQRAEFIHHYNYQPRPPAISSTTDPVTGLHLEPHLQIHPPIEGPPTAEPTYNRNYDDDEPNDATADLARAPCSPPPAHRLWGTESYMICHHPGTTRLSKNGVWPGDTGPLTIR